MENVQIEKIKTEINKVVVGKDEIIEKVMAAIFAGGHILLEDVPGVGKTTLAVAFSRTLSLDYRRIQFTPDVLPSDVVGFSMFNKKTNEFEFKEGAAMCNLLLADEINRTSPKTQAALLEVMEEKKVTVDGTTHFLPKPFIVIATENPVGYVGTQKPRVSLKDGTTNLLEGIEYHPLYDTSKMLYVRINKVNVPVTELDKESQEKVANEVLNTPM